MGKRKKGGWVGGTNWCLAPIAIVSKIRWREIHNCLFPKKIYKKSEKIAANRNGQQLQMILKLRVLKRSDVKFWRPNLFVVANFATFCSILSHLQQMWFNQKDFLRRLKLQKWDKDLTIFMWPNVKKCVPHLRICMGMDVFLGVYSCTPPSRESFNVTKSSSVWPCSVKAKLEVGCLLSRELWTEFGWHTQCSSVPHSFLAHGVTASLSVCACVWNCSMQHTREVSHKASLLLWPC